MTTSTRPAHKPSARPSAVLAAVLALASVAAWRTAVRATVVAAVPQRTWRLPDTPAFEPLDVAILPDGRLAIADARMRAVRYFDRDGRAVGQEHGATGRDVPVAVAGDTGDGSWVVAWLSERGRAGRDALEGSVADRSGINGRIVRHAPDGVSTLVAYNSPTGGHLIDLAVRTLDRRIIVHPMRAGNNPLLLSSGIPVTASGQPRIGVWRNNWVGLTQANGRPFEVYGSATAANGDRTVQLRQAITFTGEVPIAVAASEPLRYNVLVRPAAPAVDPAAAPVVRVVGAALTEIEHVTLDGAPVPPASAWPWAIDVGADRDIAISTAGETFQVIRFDALGHERHRLYGGRPRDRFAVTADHALTAGRAAAVAIADRSPLVVVDQSAVGLTALEPSGGVAAWRRGTWARDVAVAAGAVLTVDDDGRVRRFDGPGEGDATWMAYVGAAGPSRIAAAGGLVYAARPISSTIVVLDAGTGAEVGRIDAAALGAGTDDIAATADGLVFALDTARGMLAAVTPAGTVSATWPVGIASAPRFVAVADTPTGRVAVVATDGGEIERYDLATGFLVDHWSSADADGRAYVPADVALGSDGTTYVAQGAPGAVHAYPPEPVPSPTPYDAPTPTPGPSSCRVFGTKGAAPARIVLGDSVAVSITLRAACPDATRFQGADLLLVLDRSGSMEPGDKLHTVQAVAARLAHAFRGDIHRVGLVTFAADARLDVPLGPAADVADALLGLEADGTTDVAAALDVARATFAVDRRAEALPFVVVLSDGRSDTRVDPTQLAGAGILAASVVVGNDADRGVLQQIASSPDLVFNATDAGAAWAIHRRLLAAVFGTVAGDWAIDDALGPQVELVEHSPLPDAARSDDLLRWARPILPPGGITLTYRVRPLVTGFIHTNRFAYADYTDADGARRRHILPIPVVEVIAPTPSPLPTATATAMPPSIFLPVALTERCRAATRPIDAVLVLDASTSMLERITDGRTKLAAARAAVGTFLDALRLAQGDRAAVVAFHQAAAVVAPLTSDRDRLNRALAAITTDRQTCLVCGVDAAIGVVGADAGRNGRQAVIVVLTDGRSNPRPASEAVARAAAAKAAGIAVYTIGLGSDLDDEALAAVASSPRAFFRTADAAALDAIYRDIARELPCPPGSFWGWR